MISQYNLGKNQSQTLWVKVIVGGEYLFNSDVYDAPVTVAIPGVVSELLAGGGLDNYGGSLAGSSGFLASSTSGAGNGTTTGGVATDAVDFAGQVIYSKSGSNPQGQLQVFIDSWTSQTGPRTGSHTRTSQEQLDCESRLHHAPRQAPANSPTTFSAKTNVYDITGSTKIGLDGGGTMQFTFSQPGAQVSVTSSTTGQPVTLTCPSSATSGRASIIVYKSTGGVWFSGAWGPVTPGDIPQTLEKAMLSGGGTSIS